MLNSIIEQIKCENNLLILISKIIFIQIVIIRLLIVFTFFNQLHIDVAKLHTRGAGKNYTIYVIVSIIKHVFSVIFYELSFIFIFMSFKTCLFYKIL